MKTEDIRILFLAKYAPASLDSCIPTGIEDTVYAKYHFAIYRILNNLFPQILSSNDPKIILQDNLNVDFIFSLYNRMPFRNSEVFISSVAEYHNIPYLGARPNIRALAEDKHLAKMMAKYAGVKTPLWKVYNIGDELFPPDFDPPYFCKPRFGAASKGIDKDSVCSSWECAVNKIKSLHILGMDVILEQQIEGIYHTSPVLNNFGKHLFLPCIAQYSSLDHGVVTYEQKRKIKPGLTRKVVDDKGLQSQIATLSEKMYSLLQPLDYTRFDYIVDSKTGIPYFLEFNVCCNLGEHSTIAQAASYNGISYTDLIANITYSSMYRNNLIDSHCGKDL